MSCANRQDFCVSAGETFHPVVRWATDVLTTVAISAISQTAGAVVTAGGHGMPNGWPCAVVSAQGMTQINATRYPPVGKDWQRGTVLSSSQVLLGDFNSADWSPYTGGGFLVYSTPGVLTGVTAKMTIYDNPDRTGTPLATLTSPSGITIDTGAMTMTPLLQTAGLTWTTGYYDFTITDAGGVVTELLTGVISID